MRLARYLILSLMLCCGFVHAGPNHTLTVWVTNNTSFQLHVSGSLFQLDGRILEKPKHISPGETGKIVFVATKEHEIYAHCYFKHEKDFFAPSGSLTIWVPSEYSQIPNISWDNDDELGLKAEFSEQIWDAKKDLTVTLKLSE